MKIFLLLFLLIPYCAWSAGKEGYDVQERKGAFYVLHKAEPYQSLTEISRAYFVKPEILAGANNLTSQSVIEAGKMLLIPLLETNYFKMSGISEEQPGFYPLYYSLDSDQNVQQVCAKFGIQLDALMKWNQIPDPHDMNTKRLIIGWVKYRRNGTTDKIAELPITRSRIKSNSYAKGEEKAIMEKRTKSSSIVSVRNSPKPTLSIKPVLESIDSLPHQMTSRSSVKKEKSNINIRTAPKGLSKASSAPQDSVTVSERSKLKTNPGQEELNEEVIPQRKMQDTASASGIKKDKTIKQFWSDLTNKLQKKSPSNHNKLNDSIVPVVTKSVSPKVKTATSNVRQQPLNSSKPYAYKTANVIPSRSQPPRKNVPPSTNSMRGDTRTISESPPKSNSGNSGQSQLISVKSNEKVQKPTVLNKESKPANPNPLTIKVVDSVKGKKEMPATKTTPVVGKMKEEVKALSVKSNPEARLASKQDINISSPSPASTSVASRPELPEDKTVRNEMKPLTLLNVKQGKCAFFFSGPVSGHFYAFTNLASKGEIVKVVNLANERFVLAEVIGELPNSDNARGLLIKLGDNAKLPLGQNHSTFQVKVNY